MRATPPPNSFVRRCQRAGPFGRPVPLWKVRKVRTPKGRKKSPPQKPVVAGQELLLPAACLYRADMLALVRTSFVLCSNSPLSRSQAIWQIQGPEIFSRRDAETQRHPAADESAAID